LVDALLPLQDNEGMWHALLHLSPKESPAESSGTAMIATAFSRIWREGFLDDERLLKSAVKAFNVLPDYVDKNGLVLSVSPGPGPLDVTHLPYLGKAFPPGDHHGAFSVLFAAAEYVRLEKEFSKRNSN
jgi:rhamnogalacturonyl hydrolase YesR